MGSRVEERPSSKSEATGSWGVAILLVSVGAFAMLVLHSGLPERVTRTLGLVLSAGVQRSDLGVQLGAGRDWTAHRDQILEAR